MLNCRSQQTYRRSSVQEADKILEEANTHDVAFLVVGDPFGYAYKLMGSLPTHKLLEFCWLCSLGQ